MSKELDFVPDEKPAKAARRKFDMLRSVELAAKLNAVEQAYEGLREGQRSVMEYAKQIAANILKLKKAARKTERSWLKVDKWTALIVIAAIVGVVAIVIFG